MPNNLDQVAAAAPKNVKITSVRISLQALLNQTRKARESAAHMYGRSQATPAHYPVWQSSAFKHVEDPRQRFRVNLCIDPDASPVAKINLDQSVPGGRQLPHPSVIFGRRPRIVLAPSYRRGNLHRRNRWHDPLCCPGLSAPGEHHARRNAIAACNLRHLRPWRQRLLDNPRLVIMRPAPPPLQPAQNLDPHRLMTLKLNLRSQASRNATRQTRRRSSDAYLVPKSKRLVWTGWRRPTAAQLL